MTDPTIPGVVFRFEMNTTGLLHNRKIRFIRRATTGYLIEYLPSEDAAAIPNVMRGSMPHLEFVGRKVVSHEELTAALLNGTLDVDEGDFVFIDHSQTFKPEFVASLDSEPAQRLILRYATVTVMRDICEKKSIKKITRAAVAAIEGDILAKLQDRIDMLNSAVERLRRHPMRLRKTPKNVATAQSILEWDARLREKGFCGLVDGWHASGNATPRLHGAVIEILQQILKDKVTLEDVPVRRLHEWVAKNVDKKRAEIEQDFRRREQDGEVVGEEEWADLKKIVSPCIRTVTNWKNLISPLERVFNGKGPEWLLRNQLITGMGLHVERVGQVVIIDEYDTDLMSIIPWEYLLHWLGPAKLERLGISEDKPLRLVLSVMLDAFSGCIVGLQMGMTATPELAKRTIMMSMMDKTKIAKACGAIGEWNQFLRPEKLVHDSGNSYLAAATDQLCAQLRIDKVAAPKAKAFLRGLLERIFRTVHENLFAAIPGKTFPNPVRRGDYDAQAEAVLTLDDLIQILVVWVVDIYHNSPNLGRDGVTPADLWYHEMTEGMGCRPVPALKTMSHVFGTTVQRTAQATGIRIMHANYSSKEFALELLRNPKRRFRVRWWEENMSEAQVEIRPMFWIPLEVMDPRARGLSVDDWMLVLKREHIKRNSTASDIKRRAQDKIDDLIDDRIATRRKVARKTLGTEADILRLEERTLRYFTTPKTAISSDQTHDLYGVPVSELLAAHEDPESDEAAAEGVPVGGKREPDHEFSKGPGKPRRTTLSGRREATIWKPGTME